jgi:hypothetical protein
MEFIGWLIDWAVGQSVSQSVSQSAYQYFITVCCKPYLTPSKGVVIQIYTEQCKNTLQAQGMRLFN